MPSYRYSFISHAHADNDLCDPYAAALSHLGAPHYYDRENPQVGHSLSLALQQEIERAGVLIVMVSVASLKSFWVNEEIDMFFALMSEDRTRRIIPVKVTPCELPPRLKSRWWLDATALSRDDVIAQLARALEAAGAPVVAPAPQNSAYSRIVDWRHGMGDPTTIPEAIAAARPGERILIRKGIYDGGLVLDKPLELVGDGQPGDVEVRASGTNVLKFTATQGRVANLTLRQTGGGDWSCVNVTSGRLEMDSCDISSQSHCGVAIHDGADPRIHHCRIHDSKQAGVYVYDHGQGLIEDCEISANAYAGIQVKSGGAPTVKRNRLLNNVWNGAAILEQGGGVFEENELRGNEHGAWYIADDSKDKVTRRGNIE